MLAFNLDLSTQASEVRIHISDWLPMSDHSLPQLGSDGGRTVLLEPSEEVLPTGSPASSGVCMEPIEPLDENDLRIRQAQGFYDLLLPFYGISQRE